MTDEKYISGILNNDSAVIAKFYSEYIGLVRKLVFDKDTHNYVDFDDLYSDVICTVYLNIENFELTLDSLNSKLSTYIYSIANNKLIDIIRKKEKELKKVGDIQYDFTIQPSEEHDFIDFDRSLELLKTLKPPCYELLWDRYFGEIDYDVLAKKYDYSSYNSIKKKKGKCIEQAKRLMSDNLEMLKNNL